MHSRPPVSSSGVHALCSVCQPGHGEIVSMPDLPASGLSIVHALSELCMLSRALNTFLLSLSITTISWQLQKYCHVRFCCCFRTQ